MEKICAVVLAAGEGKRMKSVFSKVMHEVMFKPVVGWVYESILKSDIEDICIVVGHCREEVMGYFNDVSVSYAIQDVQLGTGHAVIQAREFIVKSAAKHVLVLTGDTPLITDKTLKGLVREHLDSQNCLTVLTASVEDPFGYGRIVRDPSGALFAIVEHKDASSEELLIKEINSGVYCFESEFLLKALPNLQNNNSQGEYYLTDVVSLAIKEGKKVGAYLASDSDEILGINGRKQLLEAQEILKNRILDYHMENGVTIMDRASVMIGADVKIGRDTVIMPSTILKGKTQIGESCTVGPFSVLDNAAIGNCVNFNSSQITDSKIGDNVNVGPYAYIRPGCEIGSNIKIGDFVELKASIIMRSSIMELFTGAQVDCTTNTSLPLTVSSIETEISPSENVPTSDFPTLRPSASAICFAISRLAFAEKILIFFPCVIIYVLPRIFLFAYFLPNFLKNQPSLLTCSPRSIAKAPSGTSFVIVDPAAV
jgi:bifunctional UDP-N-acetylglucosamine pyrophosphorylase/glucosamine-1-phosphate N-acetyltransferase